MSNYSKALKNKDTQPNRKQATAQVLMNLTATFCHEVDYFKHSNAKENKWDFSSHHMKKV